MGSTIGIWCAIAYVAMVVGFFQFLPLSKPREDLRLLLALVSPAIVAYYVVVGALAIVMAIIAVVLIAAFGNKVNPEVTSYRRLSSN